MNGMFAHHPTPQVFIFTRHADRRPRIVLSELGCQRGEPLGAQVRLPVPPAWTHLPPNPFADRLGLNILNGYRSYVALFMLSSFPIALAEPRFDGDRHTQIDSPFGLLRHDLDHQLFSDRRMLDHDLVMHC